MYLIKKHFAIGRNTIETFSQPGLDWNKKSFRAFLARLALLHMIINTTKLCTPLKYV